MMYFFVVLVGKYCIVLGEELKSRCEIRGSMKIFGMEPSPAASVQAT